MWPKQAVTYALFATLLSFQRPSVVQGQASSFFYDSRARTGTLLPRNTSSGYTGNVVAGWHSTSKVSVALEQTNQSRSITVTCAEDSCDPAGHPEKVRVLDNGFGLEGIFLPEIELPNDSQVVFTAVGVTLPAANAETPDETALKRLFVCPLVTAFTPDSSNLLLHWDPLVGKCQAALPSSQAEGLPLSSSSFLTLPTTKTRYKVGIYFGANSRRGDQFLIRHIDLVQPTALASQLLTKVEEANARHSLESWNNGAVTRTPCPSHIPSPRDLRALHTTFQDLAVAAAAGTALHRIANPIPGLRGLSTLEWDALVMRHFGGVQYRAGESVLEAGCGAGALLASLARLFHVRSAGVDFVPALVREARARAPASSFCVADARNLSFMRPESFDHSLSFGVLTWLNSSQHACAIASQLLRVTKPEGTVVLGMINDPDFAPYRGEEVAGGIGVPAHFWYKFAVERGVKVRVVRGEEIDPAGDGAYFRYNVYMRKTKIPSGARPLFPADADCSLLRSSAARPRFTITGSPCHLPFQFEGIWFDDCTDVRISDVKEEFCCLSSRCNRESGWERCAAQYPGGSLASDSGSMV